MVEKKIGEVDMAREFMGWLGGLVFDEKAFAEGVMKSHRTLQQSAFRVMMTCINGWAKQEHYDLRNEATIRICKKIVEALDGQDALPLV